MNRRAGAPIDLDHWREFDPGALTKVKRKAFAARRQAVELNVASTAVSAIEAQAGINRRQLYRLSCFKRGTDAGGFRCVEEGSARRQPASILSAG